jgi:hypothetical protein
MKKSRKLSDLLLPAKEIKIKDREELLSIYDEYLQGHFITVVNRIRLYEDFTFFVDLFIFLNAKYRSESYRRGIFWHIFDLYFEKLTI